ncbi:hypothetical protein [Rhodococcus artemisiae]|uniref:DivIVA domain-containing protein n=1 Tax=Rhodococcus artemisiae TaxID=714159 RepID=A0ABU7L9S5_9NOCA|nr:hypothetical protein [Rhodococcus artemisiae]MEE2058264.1 hypothetical protein [Rhodococcus artemisiae]
MSSIFVEAFDAPVSARCIGNVGTESEISVTFGRDIRAYLSPEEARRLIDELQEACRQAAHAEARKLQRDEDEIRAAADIREGL